MSSPTVLFVDDDPDVLTAAQVLLSRNGWRMLGVRSPLEAWAVLAAERPDVILLDLNFSRGAVSGEEGFRWLAELKAHDAEAAVVVVTGHSGVNVAVAAMKAGASDFVMKPWSNARLLETLSDALALRRRHTGEPAPTAEEPLALLGESSAMQAVRERLSRVAPTDAAVLIHGPAGSGKTLAARLLHARSARAAAALKRLDLRNLSIEPGVIGDAFSQAAGGTVVLEEISALPGPAQGELLERMDAGTAVRVVSTARDLEAARAAIRDDLFARLAVVDLRLPSLLERGEDAVLLVEHFVRLFARRYGRPPTPLDESATDRLRTTPPPGEVRGLKQAAERAVALNVTGVLTAEDFAAPAAEPSAAKSPDLNLARAERAAVETALKRHAHNVSLAAKELGLTRAALYRRMAKHGL